MSRPLGAIFAGGRARRFGSDKALALYQGRPLIAHAAAWLDRYVGRIVICGGAASLPGIARIDDWPAAGLGPLGALCAALRHAATSECDTVLSMGCDTPSLPPVLAQRLFAAGAPCYIAEMPLIGLWPAGDWERLERHLQAAPDRSMRGWSAHIGATSVSLGRDIPNINAPADLAALERSEG